MNKKEWTECLKRLKETRAGVLKNKETSEYNIKINTDQLEELDFTIKQYQAKIRSFK